MVLPVFKGITLLNKWLLEQNKKVAEAKISCVCLKIGNKALIFCEANNIK